MTFASLSLSEILQATLREEGYTSPTPIQLQAIPLVLEGRDLLGLAQTGTGKTAAFALPILDNLARTRRPGMYKGPRCLVLTPTRELALQVSESFRAYGRRMKSQIAVVFGGVGAEPQRAMLRRKPDVLVATPGRLLDFMGQGEINFQDLEIFVLDEADRMFDMGFIKDIKKIVNTLPKRRQTLLFSATMPPEIEDLAHGVLNAPAKVQVNPVSTTAESIEQFVYFVDAKSRIPLMSQMIQQQKIKRAIVFTRMKHIANKVAESLTKNGIQALPFHSNKSQNARVRALESFKQGDIQVLVATDIAARGLDVDNVEVAINFDLPDVPETYVHRIGRSGRAGRKGVAWTLVDREQAELLCQIEKVTKCTPHIVENHGFDSKESQGWAEDHKAARARGFVRKPGSPRPQPSAHSKESRSHSGAGPRAARPSRPRPAGGLGNAQRNSTAGPVESNSSSKKSNRRFSYSLKK
jgi:ATP-dependent RNA helicase RhlE